MSFNRYKVNTEEGDTVILYGVRAIMVYIGFQADILSSYLDSHLYAGCDSDSYDLALQQQIWLL
jgi:hypothetical protein